MAATTVPGSARGRLAPAPAREPLPEAMCQPPEATRLPTPPPSIVGRGLFIDRLQQAVRSLEATGTSVLVLLVELDGVAAVDRRHGRAAADRARAALVERVRRAVGPATTIAGDGLDGLLVLCEDAGGAAGIVGAVQLAVTAPVAVPGLVGRVEPGGRAGAVVVTDPSARAEEVLRVARLAGLPPVPEPDAAPIAATA